MLDVFQIEGFIPAESQDTTRCPHYNMRTIITLTHLVWHTTITLTCPSTGSSCCRVEMTNTAVFIHTTLSLTHPILEWLVVYTHLVLYEDTLLTRGRRGLWESQTITRHCGESQISSSLSSLTETVLTKEGQGFNVTIVLMVSYVMCWSWICRRL